MEVVYLEPYFNDFECEVKKYSRVSRAYGDMLYEMYMSESFLQYVMFYYPLIVMPDCNNNIFSHMLKHVNFYREHFRVMKENYCCICDESFRCYLLCDRCKQVVHRQCLLRSGTASCPYCRNDVILHPIDVLILEKNKEFLSGEWKEDTFSVPKKVISKLIEITIGKNSRIVSEIMHLIYRNDTELICNLLGEKGPEFVELLVNEGLV
jgi:hypothetical protein